METIIDTIFVFVLAITMFILSVLLNVALAMAAVCLFDWAMGTAYFSAQVVGIVALILFAIGRLNKK